MKEVHPECTSHNLPLFCANCFSKIDYIAYKPGGGGVPGEGVGGGGVTVTK